MINNFQTPSINSSSAWIPVAVVIGILFILMFRLIAQSTTRAGVTATTVAVKMSVMLPIAFSIWIDPHDELTLVKGVGILLAFVAVVLAVYRQSQNQIDFKTTIFPLALFVGMGIVDSLVKYAQVKHVTNELNPVFSFTVFGVAFLAGVAALPVNLRAAKELLRLKTWITGVALGLANFGSFFFIIKALNHQNTLTGLGVDGSTVFAVNNLGIIILNVVVGALIFREQTTGLNRVGIALSMLSILVLTYGQWL